MAEEQLTVPKLPQLAVAVQAAFSEPALRKIAADPISAWGTAQEPAAVGGPPRNAARSIGASPGVWAKPTAEASQKEQANNHFLLIFSSFN